MEKYLYVTGHCPLQGRLPKSKRCIINSFSRPFRCNIDQLCDFYSLRKIVPNWCIWEQSYCICHFYNMRICFYLSIFLAQFHIKGINSRDGSICAARVKPKNSNIWSTYNQLHHGKIHRTENDCGSNEVGCRNDEAQVHTIQCLKGCVRNKSAIRHRQFRHFCSPPLPKHIQGRP